MSLAYALACMSKFHLSNVHECLALAAADDAESAPDEIKRVAVRVRVTLADAASIVCQRHGTTISSFLRQCMAALVRDYEIDAVPDGEDAIHEG